MATDETGLQLRNLPLEVDPGSDAAFLTPGSFFYWTFEDMLLLSPFLLRSGYNHVKFPARLSDSIHPPTKVSF